MAAATETDPVAPESPEEPPVGDTIEAAVAWAVERRKNGERLDSVMRTLRETHRHLSQKVLRRAILAAS